MEKIILENRGSYLENGKKNRCCSCRACEQACPAHCISMKYENGFYYPSIDTGKCIKCGKCLNVCQFSGKTEDVKGQNTDVYAGWSKNSFGKSTSGGIFPVLAEYVLKQEGYIFGAVFTSDFHVNIIGTCKQDELENMKGSKYTRSDTQKTYSEVKELLKEGKQILYSGTPCQIAGLKKYLGKTYDNLICVDLICHGLPSEIVFQQYIKYLEKEQNSMIAEFRFRNKKQGVMGSEYYIVFQNGKQMRESLSKNKYSLTYNSLISHMPSCYSCPYASDQRVSDITIGDFWGIEKFNQEAVNGKGTSVIIANTEKGKQVLNQVSDQVILIPETMEHAKSHNPALCHSIKKHPMSERFMREITKKPFDKVYRKYIVWGNKWMLFYRLIRKMKSMLIK